jgi:hypothetical protein
MGVHNLTPHICPGCRKSFDEPRKLRSHIESKPTHAIWRMNKRTARRLEHWAHEYAKKKRKQAHLSKDGNGG